jgi:hypothetical protein
VKRLREDLHRSRFLLPFVLAAYLLLRWAVLRGRPERLVELPLGPMAQWIGIVADKAVIYGVAANNADLEVRWKAVDGSASKLVVRHPSEQSDVGAFLAGNYVYYTNVWYKNPAPDPTRPGGNSPMMGLDPRAPFLTPPMPRKPGEVARPPVLGIIPLGSRGRFAERIRTTLYRASIQDGTQEEVILNPGGKPPVFSNISVVGTSIFWTRRRPLNHAESAPFWKNGKPPAYMPSHQELWVTPVKGGHATLLYSGDFQFARLTPSSKGVYWRMVRPDTTRSSGTRDLVYVPADSFKVTIRHDATFEPSSAPVYYRGKVYWINDPTGLAPEGGLGDFAARRDLVCANPDGSDMRVVLNLSTGAEFKHRLGRLFAYRDRLYATLWEPKTNAADSTYLHYLCALDPDRDPAIVRLTRLPRRLAERGVFDDGYYYFLVNEPQDGLFDWPTEETGRPDRYILYRWRLPDTPAAEERGT